MKVGLEIHIQLKTKNKLFSNTPNKNISNINENADIFDTGMPGTLPILQTDCIVQAIKVAKIVNCNINDILTFDRKHYIYPDLPHGFQITQFFNPIGKNGKIQVFKNKYESFYVTIKQVHIEQDSAKLFSQDNKIYIDFNRSNMPLVEIVTDPCFHSIDEVKYFLKFLLGSIHINDLLGTNIENGGFRCDVNISNEVSGRVEIKNINSPNNILKAISLFQEDVLKKNMKYSGYTLGYHDDKNKFSIMRNKESSNLYRYFEDPNIPSIILEESTRNQNILNLYDDNLWNKCKENNLSIDDSLFLCSNIFFRKVLTHFIKKPYFKKVLFFTLETLPNYINNDEYKFTENQILNVLETLFEIWEKFNLTKIRAKEIFLFMILKNISKEEIIVKEFDLKISHDIDIAFIESVLNNNLDVVKKIKDGNHSLINFLIGKVVKVKSNYNPSLVKDYMLKIIDKTF